jgi:prepilin-type N-terminal cleavage/methylation domain-containing protein
MRRGVTLPELMLVTGIVGLLTAIAVPRIVRLRDRASVGNAAVEVTTTFAAARRWAVSRAARTAVAFDTASATIVVHSFGDTIAVRRLGSSHGVTLTTTRDTMAYAPNGLGYGASNLTVVLQRGAAADTVVVSRLGRVRR